MHLNIEVERRSKTLRKVAQHERQPVSRGNTHCVLARDIYWSVTCVKRIRSPVNDTLILDSARQ